MHPTYPHSIQARLSVMPYNKPHTPSAFAQTMPPTGHPSHSRLTTTIIALIALACVLVVVFIYLQSGQRMKPQIADQRVQAINESLAKLVGIKPASQENIQASLKQLSSMNSAQASESEIAQSLSQLKAQ
jgi:predicted PurR-regulated permease PerM